MGDLNSAGPLDVFADRLRKAAKKAGDPSVRDLERLSRELGYPYSRQTFNQKLNGRSKPDWQFVEILVTACARHVGRDVSEDELAGWQKAYQDFSRDLAAMRTDRRERERGVSAAWSEQRSVPPDAEFMKERALYLRRLRDRYGRLDHTNALAARVDFDGAPAPPLHKVFMPQWVREKPPPAELPREVQRKLATLGRLRNRDIPPDLTPEQIDRKFKAYADSPKRPVLEMLTEPDNDRIVLLGDPGAGKSTLAVYLTLALAHLTAGDDSIDDWRALGALARCLPVLLELRSYAARGEDRLFLDEIERKSSLERRQGMPRRLLQPYLEQGGAALVIFDGLDEVFDRGQREGIKRQIKQFAADYPGVRVIVTSRLTGYEPDQSIFAPEDGWKHYTLQDLEPKQVDDFVGQFYRAIYPKNRAEAERLTAQLLTGVAGSPAIAELASNPMLLTALALLGLGDEPPRNRGTVLAHMVEVLVKRWNAKKYADEHLWPELTPDERTFLLAENREQILRLVARRIQEGNLGASGLEGSYLSVDAFLDVFTKFYAPESRKDEARAEEIGRILVRQFKERDYILASFGDERLGFVHRALLDYLVAADIHAQFSGHQQTRSDLLKTFGDHSMAPEWQEALLLLAGMLKERENFNLAVVELLRSNPLWFLSSDPLPRNVLLAIRCLGEYAIPQHVVPASHAAADALIAMLETVSGINDYPLAFALTQAVERDVLPVLGRLSPHWAGRAAYETWYLCRGQFLRGDSPGGFAAVAAAGIYVTLLGDDARARDRLHSLARWADSAMVRGAALEALVRNWPRAPEIFEMLRASAVGDHESYVRRVAVSTLAAGWPRDSATRNLLRDRAKADAAPAVRGTAIRWLASGWRDPVTARLLRGIGADSTEPGEVRAVAAAELAAGWHNDESTRRWLWKRVADKDPGVRASVAQALAAGWHDADTRRLLYGLASGASESDYRVRVAAVRALAAGWPDRPDTRELLTDIVCGNGDTDVRQAAVDALAAGWHDDADVMTLLYERTKPDPPKGKECEPDDDVRCAMTQALAAYWPTRDARTLVELLKELAVNDGDWYVRATASQALADSGAGQQRVGQWLRAVPVKDRKSRVREVALNAAVSGWSTDPETATLLVERAKDRGEDLGVRTAAIRALAAQRHDDHRDLETLALLREVAEGDGATGDLQRVALQLVAAGWRDDEHTYPWLCQRAKDEKKSLVVRRTALQLIAANVKWQSQPDTVALLRKLAAGDDHVKVRMAAIRTYSAGWRDKDPSVAAWIRENAFAGSHPQVRIAVVRTLATDWHDDPETPRWLHERAIADEEAPTVKREAADWLARGWPSAQW